MQILHELRLVFRQLRKHPGFTLVAVLTLGLGIGAATAVFSLVDTVLLRPLPFAEPDRVMALDTLSEPGGRVGMAELPQDTSYPNFFDWRARAQGMELASWQMQGFTLGQPGTAARRMVGMAVSADFFHVLGVDPALGRGFLRQEEQAGSRSVIVSDGLWRSHFNARPDVVGKTLRLDDEVFTVVGVLPARFTFPSVALSEVWVTPAQAMEGKNSSGQQRGWNQLNVLARLAPGVDVAQARGSLNAIARALALEYPDSNARETGVSVEPLADVLLGDVRQPLRILFAAVVFLLLIACSNVAGLLLTRTGGRRAEMALRTALGASRRQIVEQVLLESLALALGGGAVGLALAAAALRVAPRFLPATLPRAAEIALNPRVFLFALAASVATALLFGVYPAWRSARLDPALALGDSTRTSTAGGAQTRLQAVLIVGETALGLVLLVAAGLLLRSFDRLLSVDPGFDAHHLATFRVGMPPTRFEDARMLALSQRLQARFAALPGVERSTFAFPMPLTGSDMSISFKIEGQPMAPGDELSARLSVVAANYFTALGLPLRRGRLFTAAEDTSTGPHVAIVNQAFADRYFPGVDAVGKRIASDAGDGKMSEIVGVVGNVTRGTLAETPKPEYYLPFAQATLGPPLFALRVQGDPAVAVETARHALAELDPTLPLYAARTDLLSGSTATQRFQTGLLTGFAALALLLAAVGLYGVLSYTVAQRRMEMGLRLALGAQRADVLGLVMRRGLTLCAGGVALGLAASALLSRSLATLLFRTAPLDLVSFAGGTALLLAVSAVACAVPAWRASRLDPNQTLRQQ